MLLFYNEPDNTGSIVSSGAGRAYVAYFTNM
jgi:hypothetical protein